MLSTEDIKHLEDTLSALRRREGVMTEGIKRLAGQAFDSGDLAVDRIDKMLAEKDLPGVLDRLDDKGLFGRMAFSVPRQHWFLPKSKARVNTAIDELKEKISAREKVRAEMEDTAAVLARARSGTTTTSSSPSPTDPWFRKPKSPGDPPDDTDASDRTRSLGRDR